VLGRLDVSSSTTDDQRHIAGEQAAAREIYSPHGGCSAQPSPDVGDSERYPRPRTWQMWHTTCVLDFQPQEWHASNMPARTGSRYVVLNVVVCWTADSREVEVAARCYARRARIPRPSSRSWRNSEVDSRQCWRREVRR
jgi:hypothetical protein